MFTYTGLPFIDNPMKQIDKERCTGDILRYKKPGTIDLEIDIDI